MVKFIVGGNLEDVEEGGIEDLLRNSLNDFDTDLYAAENVHEIYTNGDDPFKIWKEVKKILVEIGFRYIKEY